MLPRKRRVHPAARIALIKKYLASGLTQKEFYQWEKLVYLTFLSWLRKYRTTCVSNCSKLYSTPAWAARTRTPLPAHWSFPTAY
ncbi:MAG: hypothetical protein DKINENOH_01681 [bacterium]|nr:hypothetical protein [bacterium]